MTHPPWLRPVDDGVEVTVWVVPGSSRPGVVGTHGGALRVRVAAPPERGRANRELVRLLRRLTSAAKAEVVHGGAGRRKVVRLRGVDAADAARHLT